LTFRARVVIIKEMEFEKKEHLENNKIKVTDLGLEVNGKLVLSSCVVEFSKKTINGFPEWVLAEEFPSFYTLFHWNGDGYAGMLEMKSDIYCSSLLSGISDYVIVTEGNDSMSLYRWNGKCFKVIVDNAEYISKGGVVDSLCPFLSVSKGGIFYLYKVEDDKLEEVFGNKTYISELGVISGASNFIVIGETDGTFSLYLRDGDKFRLLLSDMSEIKELGAIAGVSDLIFASNKNRDWGIYKFDGNNLKLILSNAYGFQGGLLTGESSLLLVRKPGRYLLYSRVTPDRFKMIADLTPFIYYYFVKSELGNNPAFHYLFFEKDYDASKEIEIFTNLKKFLRKGGHLIFLSKLYSTRILKRFVKDAQKKGEKFDWKRACRIGALGILLGEPPNYLGMLFFFDHKFQRELEKAWDKYLSLTK